MMPYGGPLVGMFGPGLIWWALAWDTAGLLWGPMFRPLRGR